METANRIAVVEQPSTAMDAAQARLMIKLMRDPAALGDLGLRAGEEDSSILRVIEDKARALAPNGRISWGGPCEVGEIAIINLPTTRDSTKERWELGINEVGEGKVVIFSDGSKQENGRVGAGWYNAWTKEGG